MKTSELTGFELHYWVARAEGLDIRKAGSAMWVSEKGISSYITDHGNARYAPSIDWAQGGPLLAKYEMTLMRWKYEPGGWDFKQGARDFWAVEIPSYSHYIDTYNDNWSDEGSDTPLQAICRAVVRAAFGDEVGEVDHG